MFGCPSGEAATFYTLVHARTSRETLPVRTLLQAVLRTRHMHDNFTYFKPTLLQLPTTSMQPHDIRQDMTETQPSNYGTHAKPLSGQNQQWAALVEWT